MKKIAVALLVFSLYIALLALVACSEESDSLTDITWKWERVSDSVTGEVTSVQDPEKYTLILRDDGSFSGQADCNQISGTYTQNGDFILNLGPSTMAFCGEDSLDQQYIDLLSGVVAGGPDGSGGLALEWAGGEKRLEFRDGGSA